jgi:glycosyltransferase involved in cell wall biosynthesis
VSPSFAFTMRFAYTPPFLMLVSRPLRIVHVTPTPTGAPWMIAIMAEQKKLGHDVAAIVPSLDGDIAPKLAALGIPCYAETINIVHAPTHRERIAGLVRLAKLLRRLRPDVVHGHIFEAVVTGRLASWIADVPQHYAGIVGPLSLEFEFLRTMEIGTAFADTKTIASASYTRDLLRQFGVPEEKIELVFYAIDQSGHHPELADGARVRRELGIPLDAPVIGKIAYFYAPINAPLVYGEKLQSRGLKGHDVLIRAAPRVLEEFPDARFVLVGKGWGPQGEVHLEKLRELVKSLGVEQAILFPGERRDIPDTLASFDIATQCSLTDNLAGTVEALLMERPLVVSDIPGFRDTVLHEETGLVVPVDDPAALAEAILRLLRDREFAHQLGERGRQWMLERFTLQRTVADLDAIMARSTKRAEQHYRLRRSFVRALLLPARLIPIERNLRRILRQPSMLQSLVSRVTRIPRRVARFVIGPFRRRRTAG